LLCFFFVAAGPQFSAPTEGRSKSAGTQQSSKQIKSKQSGSSHSKTPPVPTLVRGSGSGLIGKKPTFVPEEIVKVL